MTEGNGRMGVRVIGSCEAAAVEQKIAAMKAAGTLPMYPIVHDEAVSVDLTLEPVVPISYVKSTFVLSPANDNAFGSRDYTPPGQYIGALIAPADPTPVTYGTPDEALSAYAKAAGRELDELAERGHEIVVNAVRAACKNPIGHPVDFVPSSEIAGHDMEAIADAFREADEDPAGAVVVTRQGCTLAEVSAGVDDAWDTMRSYLQSSDKQIMAKEDGKFLGHAHNAASNQTFVASNQERKPYPYPPPDFLPIKPLPIETYQPSAVQAAPEFRLRPYHENVIMMVDDMSEPP